MDNIHKILQTISGNSQLFRDFSFITKVGYYSNLLINNQNWPLSIQAKLRKKAVCKFSVFSNESSDSYKIITTHIY